MGLYGFKRQFVAPIKAGTKTHTIRGLRKHPDKAGNVVHLYYALRTSRCELIGRYYCTRVDDLLIDKAGNIHICGSSLTLDEMEHLACRDGFADLRAMLNFWDGRLPFEGHIIHWRPLDGA